MGLNEDIEIYMQCHGECENCTRCVKGMCPIKNRITIVKKEVEKIMNKKWTSEEEQTLIELVNQGRDNVYIAERFGVTATAVQSKKNRLRACGLLDRTDRRGRPAKAECSSTTDKEENMSTEAIYPNTKRGDIYYIKHSGDVVGSEQRAGRPAIVVSNDIGNQHSADVEIVYLTTRDKAPMPTHVKINSAAQSSTALCESVETVSKERLKSFYGTITKEEQAEIDRALLVSFGLVMPERNMQEAVTKPVCDGRAEIERDIYKGLYLDVVNRFLPIEKPAQNAD